MLSSSHSSVCQKNKKQILGAIITIITLSLFSVTANAQNNCISFDGTNDYVAIPALGNGYTQFTIETWFNATSLASGSGLNGIFNTINWGTSGDIHYQINNSKIELAVNGATAVDVSYTFFVNRWYHLATSYNTSTKKANIYVNGLLIQSVNLTTAVVANFTLAKIGDWSATRYFNGTMDEYRIWSTERSITEIRNNMFTSLAGNETGLLASYNFNQGTAGGTNTGLINVINSKGSNNGTLTNFALTDATSNWVASTTPSTIADNCLSFNGTNNWVNCGSVNPAKFTIEAWALPNAVSADQAVVSSLSTGTNTGCELHIGTDGYPYVAIRNGATWLDIKATAKAVAGVWIHLAATFDGSTCKLFVNGIKVATQTTISYSAGTSTLYLGVRSGPALYFSGKIDEVRIWNRVVTETNLLDSLYTDLNGSEKGLLAHYSFNQGIAGGTNTGLTTLISSTGTNHGTLTNFSLSGATSNWVTGFLPAPASHVTNFAGSLVSNKITLTWIDATGTIVPDAYLIYASKTNSFTNPVNGVLPADDNDLSDGTGVVRVSKGIQTYNGWINEDFNTTYYFKIYPLTNPGMPVKYYTSATVPQIQVVSKQILTQGTSNFPRFSGPSWFDYDNDGFLDLMMNLDATEKTALYRNNHNNTYSLVTYFNSPGFDYPGNYVDFDLNGFLDVTGTGSSNIYFNNSGASFTPAPSSNAGLPNLRGDWADFDRDADLDFLTLGSNGYDIKIYRRDPPIYNEVFGNSFRPCAGIIKWIDFNNDGYPDIFATGKNPLDGKLYSILYKNEGNGKFSEQTQISLPALDGRSVNIADINSDGRMDILLTGNKADNTGTVILCTNNGGINFSTLTIAGFYNCQNGQASVVDIDNDGLSDILISESTSDTDGIVKIFKNNGNGTFSDLFVQNLPNSRAGLGLFDLNNDGNLDLVEGWDKVFQNTTTSSNLPPNKITTATSVLEGNGVRFNWSATDDKTPSSGLTYELRIGTASGASNIIAASSIGSGTRKLLTTGNMGTSTSKYLQLPKGTYYWSVQAIDNSFKGGAFSDEKSFTITDVPSSKLTAEKLDNYSLKLKWTKGNGIKRAVFCKIGSAGTASPLNNKSYIASPNYGEGDQIGSTGWYCVYNGVGDSLNVYNLSKLNSYIFHVTEYNGNSGSESYVVATANGNPGVFSTAVFSEQPAIPTPANYNYDSRVYFGDFNNDNLLDFLYNYQGAIYNNINQGNNTFTQTTVPSSRPFNNSLVNVVDYNNDGWLDYSETGDYYAHWMSNPTYTRFFKNNGNNTFTENLDLNSIGTINNSMAWSDYDNDGNMDYFIGGNTATVITLPDYPYYQTSYTKISKIFRNNGSSGSFSFTEQTGITLPGLSNGAAKWGDFNNDGWPDLLFTGFADDGNYYVYLYINNKNNSFTGHRIDYTSTANSGNYALKSYLECTDFDKDGFLDFLLTTDGDYNQSNGKATLFRNNGDNTFTQDNTSFSDQTTYNQFAIGDFNNDKAVDVVFMRAGTSFKRLFKNNYPDKSFSLVPDFVSPGSSLGTLAIGDYDNDGDLDILSSDDGEFPGVCNIIKNSTIMKSGTFPANNLPAAPISIKTILTPGQLFISWDKVTTDETSNLSYNLKLEKDGLTINSPNVNLPGSKRKIPEMGNTGMNNFAVLKGLSVGAYSISVQSVDGAFAGGPWSSITSVEIKNTKSFFSFDTVCYKVATKLIDQSTSTKKIISRNWKYNNTTISTDSVAHFVFPHSGTNNLTLVITDTDGTKDSVSHAILIKAKPTALYSATTVCLGSTTVFVNNSSRNGAGSVTWNWNYDNGDPASTDSIPLNKVYGLAKTYKTKLIVTASNSCADTLSKDVFVGAIPNAITSVNGKTTFCQGDSLIISVDNNPAYYYQWKLDNNDLTNSNTNAYKVKLNSGGYSVKITNPLANCVATSLQTSVIINPVPAAPNISVYGPSTFCQGDSVLLSVSNVSGNTYEWKLNGGVVGGNQTAFTAKSSGIYSMVLSNSSGCSAKSSNADTVVVRPKPVVPTINVSGTTSFCQGGSVDLIVTNNSAYSYQWKNGSFIISGATTSTLNTQTAGIYSLNIMNSDGCTANTDKVPVTVLSLPITPLISSTGPLQFCMGDSVLLYVTTPGDSFQWKFDGNEVVSGTNRFSAKNIGTYSVIVTNINGCRATSSNSVYVTVNKLPDLSTVSLNGPTQFCSGGSVTLSVPSTNGYIYSWRNESGSILNANTSSYQALTSGKYQLDISNISGCAVKTPSVNVVVKPAPVKPIVDPGIYQAGKCPGETPIRLSVSNSGTSTNYQWYKNGIQIANANSNFYQDFLQQGVYKVEASIGDCSVQSDALDVKFDDAPAKPFLYAKGPTVWYLACSVEGAPGYKWYFNGTIIPDADKYMYVANQKLGTYNVSISNAKKCFTISDPLVIPAGITGIDDVDPFVGLKIYPNPTLGLFSIELDNQVSGALLINILDPSGKVVMNIKTDKTTEHFSRQVDLSGQPGGIYLIQTILNKQLDTRKVIVK